ncbi:hypothetical protein L0337_13000 [candidate division KSB1 bacterium]|nr:hypothetical protein [candidate division KSB1 bacterium]
MAEKKQIYANRQANTQFSDVSDDAIENGYDNIFNLFLEFAMILYMEDKLEQLLKNKNIEKKWNDKLSRSVNRYLEELNA